MIRHIIHSKKHGPRELLIDEEDAHLLKHTLYVWTTPRHSSFYVFLFDPETKKGKRIHRVITNAPDGLVVDHINGNALDNRRQNLRITSQANNNKNAKKRRSARTSQYKGVHYCSRVKKWKSQIQKDRVKYSLGYYDTELKAAKAYDEGAARLFGEFAVLNLPC